MTVYLVDSAITASFRLYNCAKASRTYCSIVHSSKHVNTLRCKISDEYVSIDNYTFASKRTTTRCPIPRQTSTGNGTGRLRLSQCERPNRQCNCQRCH